MAADADFAIGCGYKYLNGGPGAPAFVWVHPRHADRFEQPLAGWWGHAAPFEFTPDYRPAPGIARYLCGTQPILSMAALECGLDTLLAAEPMGGMAALRRKSLALTDLFIAAGRRALRRPRPGPGDAARARTAAARRSAWLQRCAAPGAYAIVQALIARGVIGDYRAGDPSASSGQSATGHPALRLHAAVHPLRGRLARGRASARRCSNSGEWRAPRVQPEARGDLSDRTRPLPAPNESSRRRKGPARFQRVDELRATTCSSTPS